MKRVFEKADIKIGQYKERVKEVEKARELERERYEDIIRGQELMIQ